MYLKRCIKSLLNQTYKSDILLSVSFKNEYYKNRFYEGIKSKFQSVIYYEWNERKSQFEHYNNLKNNIDKYDYISFCEDNDYYRKNRVIYINIISNLIYNIFILNIFINI